MDKSLQRGNERKSAQNICCDLQASILTRNGMVHVVFEIEKKLRAPSCFHFLATRCPCGLKCLKEKKKKRAPALVLWFGGSRTAGGWKQPCNVEGAGYRFRQPLLVQSHIRCAQLCLRASEAKPSCWWKHKGPSSTGWGPPLSPRHSEHAQLATQGTDISLFLFLHFFSP